MSPFIILVVSTVLTAAATDSDKIHSNLQKRFLLGGRHATQNVMVSFSEGIQKVISQIDHLNLTNIVEKRTALTNAQQAFTNFVQKPLQRFLTLMGIKYQSFWINNKMVIPNVDSRLVQAISRIPGILKIEEEPRAKIDAFDVGEPEEIRFGNLSRATRQANLEWGIKKIRTDEVWERFKGRGIVVAGIDTGVRYTHEALRNNWRHDYGWYDPYEKTPFPNDQLGHGTHTTGTIVGSHGIGVAPEATWIACKGCDIKDCSASTLFACGQWVQCPTRADGSSRNCHMAPDIVSNSWSYFSGGKDWYDGIVQSWHASGIIPVFITGNGGPNCGTARSPGDRPNVIGVGNSDINDRIYHYSGLGPAADGGLKPDVVAPGTNVRSAWHTSDWAYNRQSGTSMAGPHVSGVIALMLEQKIENRFRYDIIYNVITRTANHWVDTTSARSCGDVNPINFPNYVFGWGRIDAFACMNRLSD